MTRCRYFELVADLEHLAGGPYVAAAQPCPDPAAYYVSLRVQAPGPPRELLRNVCDQHCQDVRRLPGWCWSRPKTVTV